MVHRPQRDGHLARDRAAILKEYRREVDPVGGTTFAGPCPRAGGRAHKPYEFG